MIWERLIENSNEIIKKLNFHCQEYEEPGMERFNNDKWTNRTWSNEFIRRAHVDVVDVREEKGLWMQHVCVFPAVTNGGPIFGWDVIAGKNKCTGAFHDWSPLYKKNHPMVDTFGELCKNYTPSKKRELPDWALKIFSPHMIAASNVNEELEIKTLCGLVERNLTYYMDYIQEYNDDSPQEEVIKAQNYYCEHQQQNPHTPRVMLSLGLPEKDVKTFCTDNLFPTIK